VETWGGGHTPCGLQWPSVCLCLLGLLFALILGLSLVLSVALVPSTNSFVLSREWQCPVLEINGFPIALNVESNLGIVGIDNSSGSVQEWSSQNDWRPLIGTSVHHCEVCRYVRVAYSHTDFFHDSHGVAKWLICKLQTHGCVW
jgi:hypothetical protein